MATTFRSPGAAFSRSLMDALVQREAERRQQTLDGIFLENQLAERARLETAAVRQAALDAIAAEDRARRIAAEDRQLATAESAAANARRLNAMAADAVARPGFADDPSQRRMLASTLIREGQDAPSYLADTLRPADEPKRHLVTTTDERGRPVQRMMTEDELAGGVPIYREPREPRQPNYVWILRDGKATNAATMQATLPAGGTVLEPGSDEWHESADAVIDAIIAHREQR